MPDHDKIRRRVLRGLAATAGAAGAAPVIAQTRPSVVTAMVDPRSFGARMDATTDDSAALRSAAKTRRAILVEGPMRIDQIVDLPPETLMQGIGVHHSRVVLGPAGKLRFQGESFKRPVGGGLVRDLTISPLDTVNADVGVELRHIDHFLFDNVIFYRVGLLLDDHHYVTFRDCQFFGGDDRVSLLANCASQPRGQLSISEVLSFGRCFFSACPVELEDTVGSRFTGCAMFAGKFGIRSTRRLARGSDAEPFLMGPTVSGCMLDSIDGPAIEIEGGGTDCRIVNNLISGGRTTNSPGMRLTGSSGMEVIANRFEWCGSAGLVLNNCEKIGLIGNSFANIADGPGVVARQSRALRVVGNAFENRLRWGGSGAGGTTLALDCDDGCKDWVAMANTASGLRDPRVSTLGESVVRDNPGWPAATEGGWPAGPSSARPRCVADGYRWYDQTLGLWLHWHRSSATWRDPSGHTV